MNITIATYNIHACIGGDGRFDAARIVRVLKETDADITALQEVDHHQVNGIDLLDYLAAETGLSAIAGPTLLRQNRHFGNALLTRLPVGDVNRIDLSLLGREPRGAIDAIFYCGNRPVRLVATHLGLKPGERIHQTRRLLSLFEHGSADVSMLLGDLNEWLLWGRNLRRLRAYFRPTPSFATYPARWPLFALDRIWVNPRSRLKCLAVHTSKLAREASDHLPLKGVIQV